MKMRLGEQHVSFADMLDNVYKIMHRVMWQEYIQSNILTLLINVYLQHEK